MSAPCVMRARAQSSLSCFAITWRAVSPAKFRASTTQPASPAKASIISLDLAQCKGVPPCLISWGKIKKRWLKRHHLFITPGMVSIYFHKISEPKSKHCIKFSFWLLSILKKKLRMLLKKRGNWKKTYIGTKTQCFDVYGLTEHPCSCSQKKPALLPLTTLTKLSVWDND